MSNDPERFGNIEDLAARIAAGHKLRAYVMLHDWENGSGWTCMTEHELTDFEEEFIAKEIANGSLTVESFNEGLDYPYGSDTYITITIMDEDDEDDWGDPKHVWCDGAWGEDNDDDDDEEEDEDEDED